MRSMECISYHENPIFPESDYKPFLDKRSNGHLMLAFNKLTCRCDVQWLMSPQSSLSSSLMRNATCWDGSPLAEVDGILLDKMCPSSGSTCPGVPTSTPGGSVVMIVGSHGGKKSVEIYNPETGFSCSLPELPVWRYSTVNDKFLVCGGSFNHTDCISWRDGSWETTHRLRQKRER